MIFDSILIPSPFWVIIPYLLFEIISDSQHMGEVFSSEGNKEFLSKIEYF
jgi:hypothetical protein